MDLLIKLSVEIKMMKSERVMFCEKVSKKASVTHLPGSVAYCLEEKPEAAKVS